MSDEREEECPICYCSVKRTKMFAFPCGHSVCAECNIKMVQTANNRCPTCRTPREGFNSENSGPLGERGARTAEREGLTSIFSGFSAPGGRRGGMQVVFLRDESDPVLLLGSSDQGVHARVAAALHVLSEGPSADALGFLLDPPSWPEQQRVLPPGTDRPDRRRRSNRLRASASSSIQRAVSQPLARRPNGSARPALRRAR